MEKNLLLSGKHYLLLRKVGYIAVLIIAILLSSCEKTDFEKGVDFYNEGNYLESMKLLVKVKKGDPNYDKALRYLKEANYKHISKILLPPYQWKYDGYKNSMYEETLMFYEDFRVTSTQRSKINIFGYGTSPVVNEGKYEIEFMGVNLYFKNGREYKLEFTDFDNLKNAEGEFYRRKM